jgi:hypothetical protein
VTATVIEPGINNSETKEDHAGKQGTRHFYHGDAMQETQH